METAEGYERYQLRPGQRSERMGNQPDRTRSNHPREKGEDKMESSNEKRDLGRRKIEKGGKGPKEKERRRKRRRERKKRRKKTERWETEETDEPEST
jgi:hypothetical protein